MSERELILLRHAKSSWSQAGLDDHERPLNGRGRRQTLALAAWLEAAAGPPDLVLCSSARRTRETWEGIREAAGWDCPLIIEPALYLAESDTILEQIAVHGGDARRLLVLGHNPGISEAAARLGRRELELRTACLARFALDGDWTGFARVRGSGLVLQDLACPERDAAAGP